MYQKLSLFLLIMMPLFLSGCASDQNEVFIQGTWSKLDESNLEHKSFTWEFNGGIFYRQEEIDPRTIINSQGRYRILESDGDIIRLELYDIKGDRFTYENSAIDVKIEIDREQDTIRISSRLFRRTIP